MKNDWIKYHMQGRSKFDTIKWLNGYQEDTYVCKRKEKCQGMLYSGMAYVLGSVNSLSDISKGKVK